MGTPAPSVSTLRGTPFMARSVELDPVAGPPSGGLVIAPPTAYQVHRRPTFESYSMSAGRPSPSKTPASLHSGNRSWAVVAAP